MLEEIINNQDLGGYLLAFQTGEIIFYEGDDSRDLYILVSGEVDILKGDKKIAEIVEKGALFGEMSFLLGGKRTATVKARGDVKTIRIPEQEVNSFFVKFPNLAPEITRLLAKRLDEATCIVYGLNEFCDQLPDAVILTDRVGKILSWNKAAEKLYGRQEYQMRYKSVEEIYEQPGIYREFVNEVLSKYSVSEKVLRVIHPQKGTRFISTSTTMLYDGHHNLQCVLSLGRDVTAVESLERRYRRVRNWLFPALIFSAILAVALFFGYPYFTERYMPTDIKKQELRNQMAKDYLLLKSLLADYFEEGYQSKTTKVMEDFFNLQETHALPYKGLVLVDKDRKVFNAYSKKMGKEDAGIVGTSYGGITFQGRADSLHKVLSLYRMDKEHPMGQKGIEVAFEMSSDNHFLGWLVFQMDTDMIEKSYGLNGEGLIKFHFKRR
ncbi:MAG: cyclic nucleotide-binding domain-containing protein [Pseudomonadota bacterium]